MAIRITADSTCDLSEQLLHEYEIQVIPLHVNMDGKDYLDRLTITPKQIFDHVGAGGTICVTSAPTPLEYEAFFQRAMEGSDGLIHISISSLLSGSWSNAVIAAGKFNNVRVVDSRTLSSMNGLIAIAASNMIRNGCLLDEAVPRLARLTRQCEVSFVIDRLDYLHKGGRCSTVAALGANLLQLKPCIEVVNGELHVGKKYRGSFEKCVRQYIRDRLQNRTDLRTEAVLFTHTITAQPLLDAAMEAIRQYGNFDRIIENEAGSIISNHCGPNTIGVLAVRSDAENPW